MANANNLRVEVDFMNVDSVKSEIYKLEQQLKETQAKLDVAIEVIEAVDGTGLGMNYRSYIRHLCTKALKEIKDA